MTVVCCYASGHIAFLPEVPPDLSCLPICEGPDGKVKDFISGVARHGYNGRDLFVPGIPECGEDQEAALDALHKFMAWIGKNPPKGVEVFTSLRSRRRVIRRKAKR